MKNIRASSSASGIRNTYDQTINFSSYGGSPGASGATNSAAILSLNTALAGLSGRTQLIIDPGTYSFSSAFNIASTAAGMKLTVSAYGVTIAGPSTANGFNIGNNVYNDNTHNAKFTTTGAGASTITLVTAAQTSRFSVGKWVYLTGIDTQGYGLPSNPGLFEFKKIASIGTGTITFTEPLINSYKSTWPSYATGDASNIDQGGPANIYALKDGWDSEIEMKGARFSDTGNLTYGSCRQMIWTDCTFDTYGPCPSINLLFRAQRCTATGFGAQEPDKIVHRAEFIDSAIRAIEFQSSSINELYVSNVSQPVIGGLSTPRWIGGAQRSNYFSGLSTESFTFGEKNYGCMGPTTMVNCSSTAGTFSNAVSTPFSDMTEEGGGVLSYAGGPGSATSPSHYWAIPGGNAVLLDSNNNFARSFQISDVSQSGGRTYVTTNLPNPVPSTINGRSAPWKIIAHPCPSVTMTNCTGNTLFTTHSGLPAGTPFNSWTL
ncbi:hypothetical protein [Bradyrhizobium sp. SZCCHNRI1073]|uniref:hypothetical protein n=1 Tax=Bradyrhizobium sp. SZCCHNRI1073 TaxID=3057280 RepID=UPI002916EE68|nr:hypothetical protein [Bradyrhizobium sp. SZCCHNRI1073]